MKKNKDRLLSNIVFNTLYQILSLITPLITAPYISRVLGAEGVGTCSYATSLVTYFTIFAALGTSSYGIREIARKRENKEDYSKSFWEIELITIFSSSICLALWGIVIAVYAEMRIYLLILSFNIVATLLDIHWLYNGLEKFKYTISINSLVKILSIVAIFVFVKNPEDTYIYVLIQSGATLFGNLSMWLFLPRVLTKTKISLKNFKVHLKNTFAYFVPTIATSIYTIVDKTMIGWFTQSKTENGFYEQATKLVTFVKTLSFVGIIGVISPRMSFLYKLEDKEKIQKFFNLTLEVVLTLTIASAFGLFGVAENFVPIFFGEGYDKTVLLIWILCPIIIIIGLSNMMGNLYYTPSGKRLQSAKYLIIGSLINLILNLILIPFISSIGAAIASIIAELVITALYFYHCPLTDGRKLWKALWKKLLAGGIMLAVVFLIDRLIDNRVISLVVQVSIGAAVYFLILILLKDGIIKNVKLFFRQMKARE